MRSTTFPLFSSPLKARTPTRQSHLIAVKILHPTHEPEAQQNLHKPNQIRPPLESRHGTVAYTSNRPNCAVWTHASSQPPLRDTPPSLFHPTEASSTATTANQPRRISSHEQHPYLPPMAEGLKKVAADLRASIWKHMVDAGIKYIPRNTFSYYDQVLDTTATLGVVPPKYGWTGGEIGFDTYFSMAKGNASVPAMEMTKWFDTNYSLMLLTRQLKNTRRLRREVVADLKATGASWIQFDEPSLVLDLESHKLQAFTDAYSELASTLFGLNALVETYFADISAEAYKLQGKSQIVQDELARLGESMVTTS